ncbi:hypothetical protein I6N90_00255 [Paenibacillus sp. GSMTC-2017]|uniref:hypothetical protein n=1 Tax=Paenibacillus sp. GSMTC-2017 TaxID=2794350 RepID=UPI0018D7115F|nr:hypothetical protein [Paenibacillus sp. GSMTC-2017]MBH5316239.1 hypothetical protein [Paenibacillus sp. GSMTC-2017]
MRKYLLLLIVALLLLGAYFWKMKSDAKEFTPLLDQFYSDFINRDYPNTYKLYNFEPTTDPAEILTRQGSVAQSLINERNWYGKITGYKHTTTNWKGFEVRKATIKINIDIDIDMGNYEVKQYKDTLILVKKSGEWKIDRYHSGAPWNLP